MPEPASLPGGLRLVRRRGLRHANGGRLPEGTSRKAPATKNRWETRPMAKSVPNPGLTSNGGLGKQLLQKRAAELGERAGDTPPMIEATVSSPGLWGAPSTPAVPPTPRPAANPFDSVAIAPADRQLAELEELRAE